MERQGEWNVQRFGDSSGTLFEKQKLEYSLTGLIPKTLYFFKVVVAINMMHERLQSEIFTMTTPDGEHYTINCYECSFCPNLAILNSRRWRTSVQHLIPEWIFHSDSITHPNAHGSGVVSARLDDSCAVAFSHFGGETTRWRNQSEIQKGRLHFVEKQQTSSQRHYNLWAHWNPLEHEIYHWFGVHFEK